jgi:tripartite-type tricarboxylate transporter receptor subunit TctC
MLGKWVGHPAQLFGVLLAYEAGMQPAPTKMARTTKGTNGGVCVARKETSMSRYLVLVVVVVAVSMFGMSPAPAQQDAAADYPSRSVKIIVSVPAGGGVDTVTRLFAARLQQRLGQPFVIENRGGGGGNIGAEAAYTADPDGYTLLATQPAPITSNIALYKKLSFDPVALEPVAVMSKFPNTLLVRQEFPAKTAQEFMGYVKANPGKVNYASQGVGTTSHLTAELFNAVTAARSCTCRIAAPDQRSMTLSPATST